MRLPTLTYSQTTSTVMVAQMSTSYDVFQLLLFYIVTALVYPELKPPLPHLLFSV